MTATTTAAPVESRGSSPLDTVSGWVRREGWVLALAAIFILQLALTKFIQPSYAIGDIGRFALSVLPLALAAVAQAIVVIAGGIDLSIGSMMALTSVVAASQMINQSEEHGVMVAIGVLGLGLLIGAINGALVVMTRVADIIVTLAMSFVWAGCALLVLNRPGGGASEWLSGLVSGSLGTEWVPKAAVVLIAVVALVWIPVRASRMGLSIYAIGSNQLAAFRSGVSVGRTKIFAYALTGLIAAFAGLALTATTGIGTPLPGGFTLTSVAAVVLGGVSLAGGRGGLVGPIIAVLIISLIRTDLTFLSVNTNLATVAQGLVLIAVVMFGSLAQLRRSRA